MSATEFDNRLQSAVRHQSKRGRYQLDLRLQGSEERFGTLRKVGAFRLQKLAGFQIDLRCSDQKEDRPDGDETDREDRRQHPCQRRSQSPGFRRTHLSRTKRPSRTTMKWAVR